MPSFNRTNLLFSSLSIALLTIGLLAFSSASVSAKSYTLDTGDLLELTFLERPLVNGTYVIGPDGMVSIPGLGAVKATGETTRTFEVKLLEIAKETTANPSLAIQIVEYRPFFILGDVKESGQHAYVPGMSVMQAVSLAKGFGLNNQGGDALVNKLANLRAQQAYDQNVIELMSARIRLARTQAEQAGAESFEHQVTNTLGLSNDFIQSKIADEKRIFVEQTTSFDKNLELSRRTLEARQRESASFDDRIDSQNEILQNVADELEKTKALRKKGLISASQLNELVRRELSTRGEVLQTRSLLRQAEASESRAEQELYALESGRKVELATSIQKLSESISKLEARIDGDISILSGTGGGRINNTKQAGHTFELYRGGALLPIDVNLQTPLEPGDTLFVIKERISGSIN